MSLDLIKSYLIGLGFEIDKASLDTATSGMDNIQRKVEDFNEISSKGFSETGGSLKDLFSLLNSSHTLGSLFPGLRKPLKGLLLDLKSIKDYYDKLSSNKSNEKDFVRKKEEVKDKINETVKNVAKESVKVKESVKDIVNEHVVNKTTETFKDTIKETINEIYKFKESVKDIVNEHVVNKTQENIIDRIKEKIKETEIIKNRKLADRKDVPKLKDNISYKEVTPVVDIKKLKDMKESIKTIGVASENTGLMVNGFKDGLGSLVSTGGTSLKAFSVTSVVSIAVVAGAILGTIALITAFIVALKKLASYLSELANRDIEYEKLSRMLWTTKETAKEVSQALDVLGASMQDLWLSPTLLKQFNQLRKDSSQLRIPKEFYDNLKVVQGVGLEFKRLKQLVSMLFQWIGHYILKYLSGPLAEAKKGMGDFNSWLIQNIPKIAEVIGTTIGLGLKFLAIVGKILVFLWKLTSPIWRVLKLIGGVGKGIDKLSDGTKKAARIILAALAFAFSPLLLVIALIDDLLTFMRGGESVIGDVLEWIRAKWDKFIDSIIDKFWILRKILNIKDEAKDWWQSYYESGSEYLDQLWNKAKTVLGDIKEWSKNTFEKGKDWISDKVEKGKDWIFSSDMKNEDYINISKKVINFDRDYGNSSQGTVSKSYMTNTTNSTRTITNSNEIINENVINVYGNDAHQTGNVINKRLTSITSRNLQGVVE